MDAVVNSLGAGRSKGEGAKAREESGRRAQKASLEKRMLTGEWRSVQILNITIHICDFFANSLNGQYLFFVMKILIWYLKSAVEV